MTLDRIVVRTSGATAVIPAQLRYAVAGHDMALRMGVVPGKRRKAGFCGQLDTRRSRPPRTRPPHEHGRFQRPSKARTRSAVNGQSSSRPSAAANTGTREP